jgi:ubiquinone/menaquinone biosynthesis C-methylase UbiE
MAGEVQAEAPRRWLRAFLGLFFRLLYEECSWAYDAVAWAVSAGRWWAWGRTVMQHLRGPRVLELGHGPGHLLVTMARCGLRPVGLDPSPQMGRLARRRLRRAALGLPLVRARAQALPFRDGCFDSVVATFPSEYILDPATWREAARVVRSGGTDQVAGRVVVAAGVQLDRHHPLWRPLAWLYRVTGESPEACTAAWAPTAEKVAHWLQVRMQAEHVGRTQVVLLVGEKVCTPTQAGQGGQNRNSARRV